MQISLRRGLAAVATSALVLGGLSFAAPAQAASNDPAPSRAAASWLTAQVPASGVLAAAYEDYITGEYKTFDDYGNTVDLAEGLVQVDGHQSTVVKIVDAVEANLDAYVTFGDSYFSGSGAKALALLQSQGRDVTTLTGRVEASVITSGPSAGRLADQNPAPDEYWSDWANSIGQAYAARALSAIGSQQAERVTDFLLEQQCAAGFVRLYFNADKTAADQSCDTATPAEPAQQAPDTTALFIIQTTALAKTDARVAAARARAATWLAKQQKSDGSFVDPNNGANANTTGLAGWALAEAGHTGAATRAATWLRAKQVVSACAPAAMRSEHGAVAYNDDAWNLDQRFGITDLLDRSQWVIADVQALPALASAPANPAKDAVVLPKFAKAGSTVTASIRGIAAGERACTTGAATASLLGTGSNLAVKIPGAKAGTRTLTLKTASGTTSGSVKVLGKKKLTVKVAKSAKRGSKKSVTVKGLAAGEKVTVTVKIGKAKAKKVKVGTAGKKGTFTLKVKVGKKRGTVKVSATGQYSTRTGAAKVSVK